MDNIIPTLAEFIFLSKLYHAYRRGFDLSTDSPPAFERLADKDFISVKRPRSLFNGSSAWEFHIEGNGIDFYLLWRQKLIVYSIGLAVSVAGIVTAIA